MSIQSYPCADCNDCIHIGDGEGLCDFNRKIKDKFVVDLFDVYPECPKPKRTRKGEGRNEKQ